MRKTVKRYVTEILDDETTAALIHSFEQKTGVLLTAKEMKDALYQSTKMMALTHQRFILEGKNVKFKNFQFYQKPSPRDKKDFTL